MKTFVTKRLKLKKSIRAEKGKNRGFKKAGIERETLR